MERLAIVIVNYKSAALTIDCLRSLAPELATRPGVEVVVVDNASGDGSAERLAAAVRDEGWSGFARVQPEATNSGFAGGNNAAIRPLLSGAAPPDFVMLLNPDTIVRPGALSALLAFVRDRPEIGIAGTRLEFPDGTPQFSAFRFPSLLGEVERGLRLGVATRLLRAHRVAPPPVDQAHRTDWVSGAA